VLGAHEGEGLVVEADAEVAGSRSPWIADNGQRVRPCLLCSPGATSAWACLRLAEYSCLHRRSAYLNHTTDLMPLAWCCRWTPR
jgi:hypothetical protein